jgi:hypothetical protein
MLSAENTLESGGGATVADDDPAYARSYFSLDTFLTGIMISVFIFE